MHETGQYLQAAFLLLLLTSISVFSTEYPYICILAASLLMIIFTVRSLSDRQSGGLIAMQSLLTALFILVSGNTVCFLAGFECRFFRRKALRIAIPSALYAVAQAVRQTLPLPRIIINMILLAAVSAVIFAAEYLLRSYISARSQISRAISVAAVNEMYEKKLNHELVIKKYLAEKNARLEERENISRNIHNSVGHSITAAIMTLEAADMLFEAAPDKARGKMNAANERMRTGLASIRHAVRVLDSENRLVGADDFISLLNAVTDSFVMDTTIQIRSDYCGIHPDIEIPHEHTEFLTGALQELLSNGVRHGNASRFTVILTADSGHIKLGVTDNGTSDFCSANSDERIRGGFGLKKLIAYASRCGGSAYFANKNGFCCEITLPLLKEDENE